MRRLARNLIVICASCLILGLAAKSGTAGVAYVNDESTFRLVSPPLATQTFGSANVPTGGTFENEGLNSSTNDGVFSTGSILPGLTFSTSSGLGLYILGPGDNAFYGLGANNNLTSVSCNLFNDALVISFATPQAAVGLNLLGTSGTDLELDLYSTSNVLLGIYLDNAPLTGDGGFIGMVGTFGDSIGTIVISTPFAGPAGLLDSALVSRVLFTPAVTAVPEPGSLFMMGLGVGTAGLAAANRSRSRRNRDLLPA